MSENHTDVTSTDPIQLRLQQVQKMAVPPTSTSNLDNMPSVVQSVNILFQAVTIAQKAGIFSLGDSANIHNALQALRFRLHLNQNMLPNTQNSSNLPN